MSNMTPVIADDHNNTKEKIARNSDGSYLLPHNAFSLGLNKAKVGIKLTWKFAEGYRLDIEETKISTAKGFLGCEWSGQVLNEVLPGYESKILAKTAAVSICKVPDIDKHIPEITVAFSLITIDGKTFPNLVYKLKAINPRYSIGVAILDLSAELKQFARELRNGGALIANVKPDSPANFAGLVVGDMIIAVNQIPIHSARDFVREIQSESIPDRLNLKIYRMDRIQDIVVLRKLNE